MQQGSFLDRRDARRSEAKGEERTIGDGVYLCGSGGIVLVSFAATCPARQRLLPDRAPIPAGERTLIAGHHYSSVFSGAVAAGAYPRPDRALPAFPGLPAISMN